MDVSKLEVGMRVKNYKALCELLGEKVKGGNAKKSQLEDFSRYCDYRKDGYTFIIDKIHPTPPKKMDKRKDPKKISNNNKYSEDIQALVISMLARAKDNEVFLPANRMFAILDMVNSNYATARKEIAKLTEISEVPEQYCHDFFSVNNLELKKKLESGLRGLRNRALIMWEKSVTVCVLVADEEYNDFGDIKVEAQDDIRGTIKYHREHREATRAEKQLILNIETQVLAEMNSYTLQHIFLTGRWKQFQSIVRARLIEEANIDYYYDSYKITFNKDDVYKDYLRRLKPTERAKITANLNENISNMINNHAATLHRRAIKKDALLKHEILHATDEYTEYTKKLNEIVIKKDAKDIRKELKRKTTRTKKMTQ